MSTKELGRSVYGGRAVVINQTAIKAIINHHGQTVKFSKISTIECTCKEEFFGTGRPDCPICGGTGYVPSEMRYIQAHFTPYSYFSGADNQRLIYKFGVTERSNIKMYVTGDTLRDMEPRNNDYVRWRNVNYFVVMIMPYTGTESYINDDELLRHTVFAEISLSIKIKEDSGLGDRERIQ